MSSTADKSKSTDLSASGGIAGSGGNDPTSAVDPGTKSTTTSLDLQGLGSTTSQGYLEKHHPGSSGPSKGRNDGFSGSGRQDRPSSGIPSLVHMPFPGGGNFQRFSGPSSSGEAFYHNEYEAWMDRQYGPRSRCYGNAGGVEMMENDPGTHPNVIGKNWIMNQVDLNLDMFPF